METHPHQKPAEEFVSVDGKLISRTALLDQLERLVESRHFRNSKRYPAFLRFVVEHTLSGATDSLKERTLGVDVFARPSDYDTNADPIVRVTAGEVRKRIAQYYQEPGHEYEVRIDLPLGAYVPHFFSAGNALHAVEEPAHAQAEETSIPLAVAEMSPSLALSEPVVVEPMGASTSNGRSWIVFFALVMAMLVLAGLGMAGWRFWRSHRADPGLDALWLPLTSSPHPVLGVVGVHTLDRQGNEIQPASHAGGAGEPGDMLTAMVRSDMVPVSDVVSYSRITDLLTRRSHPYATLGSADATLEQVRAGPVVLVGGLDNIWTLRLTAKLRYRFFASTQSESSILDSEHPETRWTFDNLQRPVGSAEDYAIVASYFDDTIDQPVVVIAGIGKAGTLVASEFMTSDQELRSWMRQAHVSGNRNVEMVLATEILDGQAGPPRVVASVVW